jgi:diaminohydroxyphosphoribosylaminopyrimidine deaminase/5-amino-6-(5-phosphoribosylamino)uracil reductase
VTRGDTSGSTVAACWRAMTLLADELRQHGGPVRSCSLLVGGRPHARIGSCSPIGDGWHVGVFFDRDAADDAPPPLDGERRYLFEDLIVSRVLEEGSLPREAAALLELYLPYCVAPLHARNVGRPFTVSHFAQSLDGRIATDVGDSRWIGCDENLVHAHRMRALCDAILIGADTLRTDRPALTVRHAEGPDPIRIVVGDACDVECLERAGPSPILVLGDAVEVGDDAPSTQVERVALPRKNGLIATSTILGSLYDRGILSVYIEGGATTTSAFLAEGNIDVLQLHISPMIIGPGISSFSQPEIRSVAESVRFGPYLYRSVGDGMMFVGRVNA